MGADTRGLSRKAFFDRIEVAKRLAALKAARLPGDTAEARNTRMARATWDVAYFLRTYLPHYFSVAFEDFHHELLRAAATPGLWNIRIPRDHGKTTLLSFGFTLHQVVCGDVLRAAELGQLATTHPQLAPLLRGCPLPPFDPYIQVIGCTLDGAAEITEAIKADLENNELLRGDWGAQVTDPGVNYDDWRATTGVRVKAFGLTGAIRGGKNKEERPTLAFIDDPQNDDTVRSIKRRNRDHAKIQRAVKYGLKAAKRRVIVIGTPLHHDAIVCRLTDPVKYPTWRTLRYSARRPDGTPLFPGRWTQAEIDEAALDPEASGELFDVPPDDGQRTFPPWQKYSRADLLGRKLVTVMAVDPAVGRTSHSDYQAIIVLKADLATNVIYIWRVELTRLAPAEWARLVATVYRDEDPDIAVIETIAQQEFARELILQAPEMRGVFPAFHRVEAHDRSKHIRISGLIPGIRDGGILLPDDHSARKLEQQAEDYPEGKVDGLDALAMGRMALAQHATRRVRRDEVRHRPGRRSTFRRAW